MTKIESEFIVKIKHSHRLSQTMVEADIKRLINKHSSIICLSVKKVEEEVCEDNFRPEGVGENSTKILQSDDAKLGEVNSK